MPFLQSSSLTKIGEIYSNCNNISSNTGKNTGSAVTVEIGTVIVSSGASNIGLLHSFSLLLSLSPFSLSSLGSSVVTELGKHTVESQSLYVCMYVRGQLHRPVVRGTTCCKNDNEVITDEIAYAIVADFPLFRFRSDAPLRGKRATLGLNRKAEIAEVAEFMESADPAFREPVIEEVMTNIERLDFPVLRNFFRLYLRAV